jgi:hypothetical protein
MDEAGNTHDTQGAMTETLFSAFAGGYQEIPVDEERVEEICGRTQGQLSRRQQEQLERTMDAQELRRAVLQGAGRKSPGQDGMNTCGILSMGMDGYQKGTTSCDQHNV